MVDFAQLAVEWLSVGAGDVAADAEKVIGASQKVEAAGRKRASAAKVEEDAEKALAAARRSASADLLTLGARYDEGVRKLVALKQAEDTLTRATQLKLMTDKEAAAAMKEIGSILDGSARKHAELAAQVQALSERLDPASAKTRVLADTQKMLSEAVTQGIRTQAEADAMMAKFTKSVNAGGGSLGNYRQGAMMVQAAMRDTVMSISSGIPVFTILAQQGPQAAAGFQQMGITIPRAMIGAVTAIGVFTAAVGIGISRVVAMREETAKAEQATRTFGGRINLSAEQIRQMAENLRGLGTASQSGFEQAINDSAKFSAISDTMRQKFAALASEFAIATGTDLPNAVKTLGQAFDGGVSGLKALDDQYNIFTVDERNTIGILLEHNKVAEATNMAMDAMTRNFGRAGEAMGPMQRLGILMGNVWRDLQNLLEPVGNIVVTVLEKMYQWTKTAFEWMAKLVDKIKEIPGAIREAAQGLADIVSGKSPTDQSGREQTIQETGVPTPSPKPQVPGTGPDAEARNRAAKDFNDQLRAQAIALGDQAAMLDKSSAAGLRLQLQMKADREGTTEATAKTREAVVAIQEYIDATERNIELRQEHDRTNIEQQMVTTEIQNRTRLRAVLEAETEAREKHYNETDKQRLVQERLAQVIAQETLEFNDNSRQIEDATRQAHNLADAYNLGGRHVAEAEAGIEVYNESLKSQILSENDLIKAMRERMILSRNAATEIMQLAQANAALQQNNAAMAGVPAAYRGGEAAGQEAERQARVQLETAKARAAVEAEMRAAEASGDEEAIKKAGEHNDMLKRQIDLLDEATKGELARQRAIQAAKEAQSTADDVTLLQREVQLTNELPNVREKELAILSKRLELQREGIDTEHGYGKEILDNIAAQKDLQAQIEEQDAARDKFLEPFKSAVGDIENAFTDLFQGIMEKGIKSFDDFGDAIRQIFMRLVAQIAEMMIIRPILAPIAGSLGMPGYGGQGFGAFGGGGAGAMAGGSPGLTAGDMAALGQINGGGAGGAGIMSSIGGTVFPILGGGMMGFGLGSMVGGMMTTPGSPNAKNSQLGAGGLALAGAGAGFMIGGPIGAAVGGLLGGLIGGIGGGLFGNGKPQGHGSDTRLDPITGQVSLIGGDRPTSETNQAATQLAQNLGTVIKAITAATGQKAETGGQFLGTGATASGEMYLKINGQNIKTNSDSEFMQAVIQNVSSLFPKLDDLQKKVILASSSAQDLAENLDFLAQYKAIIADTGDEAGPAKQQLDALNDSIDAMKAKAADLGLSVQELSDVAERGAQKIRDNFNKSISDAMLQLTDPVQASLNALEDERKKSVQDAKDIGADINAVEEFYALKRKQIIDQANGELVTSAKAMAGTIRQTLEALQQGPASTLSPQEKYQAALAQFNSLDANARASGGLPQDYAQTIQTFLDASKTMYATTTRYAQDYDRTISLLQDLLNLPHYAMGGTSGGGWSIVGELGPELVNLSAGSRVRPMRNVGGTRGIDPGAIGGATSDRLAGALTGIEAMLRSGGGNDAMAKRFDRLMSVLERFFSGQSATGTRPALRPGKA